MVKRAKTPDAPEDEKYFTVYQPYPLNANWELPSDYITFSRWIASCIGPEPLHGLMYKPRARGMVLLQIDKSYAHNDRLLGEHRWSEFLENPSKEEEGKVSQIFHCLYTTGREAQKDGWKHIHVEASWFKDPNLTTPVFHSPYPTTYWCPVPPEDKTNKPLCRHLPKAVKPPPPRAAPVVVGSADWAKTKGASPQNTAQALKDSWAKKAKAPTVQVPKKTTPAPAPAPARTAPAPTSVVPPVSAWNKPIAIKETTSLPAAKNPASTASGPALQTLSFPPGLAPRTGDFAPPGLVRKTDSGSTNSGSSYSTSPTSPASPVSPRDVHPLNGIEVMFEEKVTISLSPSQNRELYGIEDDASPDPNAAVVHPWEQAYIPSDNLWDDVGPTTGNLWKEEKEVNLKPAGVVCPVHGIVCKKGICREMAKLLRDQERAKALQEKMEKKGPKANNRRGGGWRQNPSGPESIEGDDNVDEDGFSQVGGGRNKGRRNEPGRGRQDRADNNSPGAVQNANGGDADWDTASVGPWG